jgi:hypothetical protein
MKFLCEKIFADLNAPNSATSQSRTIVSNTGPFLQTITALSTLCRADKRICAEVCAFAGFNLSDAEAGKLSLDARFANVPPQMMMYPQFIEPNGIAGVAVEHRTLLGE